MAAIAAAPLAAAEIIPAERLRGIRRRTSWLLFVSQIFGSGGTGGGGEPLLGRDDAIGQARALEALHDSARTGRSVAL